MTQYSVLDMTFMTHADVPLITELNILFLQKKKQSMQFSTLSWRRKMRYNFSHEQLVELHSGVKNGTWVNHEIRMEVIKLFEDYFVELATSPLYKITKKKLGEEK